MSIESYEMPNDYQASVRTLQVERVPLGSTGRVAVFARIIVVWISYYGILHWDVRLENGGHDLHDEFKDLLGSDVKLVDHVFTATREAVHLVETHSHALVVAS